MPTEVTFVCAAVLNVPVNVAPELPIVAACRVVPFNVPLRVNPVSVPTEVMLVCAAVCSTPVILGACIALK